MAAPQPTIHGQSMNAPPPDQPINAARHVLLALAETFDLVAGYCDDGGHRKLCLATKATRAKALRRLVLVTFGAANERAWSRAPARSPEAGALAGPRFCRCARSLTVGALRARIGRSIGRDMGARNLRLASSDLEKLRDDGATLASLLGTAAAPRLEVLVTERICNYDYDSDEEDVRRTCPGYFAPAGGYVTSNVC